MLLHGALAEKLGTGLQNLLDGSVTRTHLQFILLFLLRFQIEAELLI